MKTIYFSHNDNQNINIENESEIAARTARLMEQHLSEDSISVDSDGCEIIEYLENEDSITWGICNVNYSQDGEFIESVDIGC